MEHSSRRAEIFSFLFGFVEKKIQEACSQSNSDLSLEIMAGLYETLTYSLGVVEALSILSGVNPREVKEAFNNTMDHAYETTKRFHSKNCSGCKEEVLLLASRHMPVSKNRPNKELKDLN